MAYPTLTISVGPSVGASISVKPKVIQTSFGDGYIQRTADGLNTTLLQGTWTFEYLTRTESVSVFNFLQGLGGYQVFLYTIPGETTPRKFVSPTYRRVWINETTDNIEITYQEVIDP